MVTKKAAAAGIAALATVVVAAAALSRKVEAPPEGAPEGHVTLEVIPLGPQGYGFEDVQGQYVTGALVRLTGRATGGAPAPDMMLDIYDNGVVVGSASEVGVTLNQDYFTEVTIVGAGAHIVFGRLFLDNPLGSFERDSSTQSFSVGYAPTGEVVLTVTPQ